MPSGLLAGWRATIRPRLLTATLVVAAGVVSVIAVAVALLVRPSLDVTLSERGDTIAWVQPAGGSWQAGVRPGQPVRSLAFGPSAADWQLETTDAAGGGHGSSSIGEVDALRSTVPFGIAATMSGLLAFLAFARRSRLAAPLAPVALLLAQPAFRLVGGAEGATLVVGAMPVFAASGLALTARHRRTLLALLAAAVISVAWAAAREWAVGAFDAADAVSVAAAISLVGAALFLSAPWRRWMAAAISLEPSVVVDLGVVALIVALGIVALTALSAPLWAVVAGAAALLALYPRLRRRLGAWLEELIVGGARQQASISATEEERARLAHEIHDGPLQELAAVIGRLDDEPQMTREAGVLRDVAAELRGVTTALRPPVLDDLGLGAGVAFVVDQSRLQAGDSPTIASDVEDRTRPGRGGRPPHDVELAAFRIVQEALGNAIRHAQATRVAVAGSVSAAAVHLEVRDDGRGLDPSNLREARRAGHLGLLSMRQRAAAIGAELSIGAYPGGGTLVSLDWSADR